MENNNTSPTTATDTSQIFRETLELLSVAKELPEITTVIARAARALVGADGATFVLREDDKCYYADEDAISPLWKGRRFPIMSCISGWSMIHREVVTIRDIYVDERIPVDAYRPTFVKSLCMTPIRTESPLGAIGVYWSCEHVPTADDVKLLTVLANNSAVALENFELRETVKRRTLERQAISEENKELEFLTHAIAHDLRSPVAAMVSLAELIERQLPSDSAGAKELLQLQAAVGQRLGSQISQMLSVYKSKGDSLSSARVDISEMCRNVLEQLKRVNFNHHVVAEIESGLEAWGDRELLLVVIDNLLSNAFKFTRNTPGAKISVGRAGETKTEQIFFVRDNGSGFDPAKAHLLFQPLSRLHENTEFKGFGIGLASVARIINLHGGKIWAEGRPKEGATFFFSLPRH